MEAEETAIAWSAPSLPPVTTATATPVSEPEAPAPEPEGTRSAVPTWLIIALVATPTVFILLIMSGAFSGLVRGSGAWLQFPDILSANTPTGGDMGAHVLLPQLLRDTLLPSGQLFGWSNDWYAGFPALYFYFPIPALTTVILDLFMPYGVAFKLVTIAGLVALPTATYFFVRWLGLARLVAGVAAVAGGMFVFMESFSIFGANIKSTLAGEFSFSWSFALSVLYLGLVARDTREGRKFEPWPGVLLALTHIVTTMVVVVVAIPLLFRRNGLRTVGTSWLLGFGLGAFWALPLGVRVLQGMTTDMGWAPVTNVIGDAIPGSPLPGELIPILVLGIIGAVWTMLRRDDVSMLLWMTAMPVVAYFLLPRLGVTVLYNARLLPYWYYGLFVLAGIALGLAAVEISRRFAKRRLGSIVGALGAAVILLVGTAVSIHDVPGWVTWNYEGYEGKADFADYEALMETIDELPPGRVMWEANSDMNKYGTPMALMLFPYWSEGHPSMEGLFFESSLTTPFHFLNAAEVSRYPSNPVRGLTYHSMDFERAAEHLAIYDVAYYVSFTEEATTAAREFGFRPIAEAPPWTIFTLPDSEAVDIAAYEPAVWDGGGDFTDAALEWYDDVESLDRWLVATGPDDWRRVEQVEDRLRGGAAYALQPDAVSDVVIEDDRISFATTAIGVPHLVKVSYFPNWRVVEGAEGPYRAAPSLMVVVPTSTNVVIEFRNTAAENLGLAITIVTLLGLGTWAFLRYQRTREARMDATS